MTWAKLIHAPARGLGWVQWVDRANAEGWERELRRLLAAPRPWTQTVAVVRAGEWAQEAMPAREGFVPEQLAATRAIWAAVSAWLRAVDLPPPIFVPYARALLVTWPGVLRPALDRVLAANSPEYLAHVTGGDPATVSLVLRVSFDARASVLAPLLAATAAPPTPRGVDFSRINAANAGGVDSGNASIWSYWAWSEWYPGAGTAGQTGEVVALAPLSFSFDFGVEMASWITGRSMEAAVGACREYAAVKNLETAKLIAPDALPREALELIVRTASADQRLSHTVDPNLVDFAAVGGSLGLAAGAVPGGQLVGLFIGLATGLGAALQTAFGRAVGYSVDGFGRREPVLEATAISGSLAPMRAPTTTLVLPAGYRFDVIGAAGPIDLPPVVTVHDITPRSGASSSGGAILALVALAALLASGSTRRAK